MSPVLPIQTKGKDWREAPSQLQLVLKIKPIVFRQEALKMGI